MEYEPFWKLIAQDNINKEESAKPNYTKPGNKNQSKLTSMILMIYRIEGIGRIKLTVGVRRRSGYKIQYGISAVADDVPIQAIVKNKHTKKAPHKK